MLKTGKALARQKKRRVALRSKYSASWSSSSKFEILLAIANATRSHGHELVLVAPGARDSIYILALPAVRFSTVGGSLLLVRVMVFLESYGWVGPIARGENTRGRTDSTSARGVGVGPIARGKPHDSTGISTGLANPFDMWMSRMDY